MALPTPTKTWQFNANNAQAALGSATTDNKTLILAIKNAMVGFGTQPYTVGYSCNSVTAGTVNDGVDRITTIANIVTNTAGNAHSWIVLKQSGISSGFQLLIAFDSGTLALTAITVRFSPAAGFTGGTTTANPTATDQVTLISSQSWGGQVGDVAYRWTVMQSSDGQCLRVVIFSAGVLVGSWYLEKLANATGGTPGYINQGYGLISVSVGPNFASGLTFQNSASCSVVVSGESAANGSIASEVTGVFDIFPIALVGTTVGARGRIGTLQDMWAGSAGVAVGDVYPATGSPAAQFVQISQSNTLSGGIILPWNNGPVNLT
jgi:hypothetical protein